MHHTSDVPRIFFVWDMPPHPKCISPSIPSLVLLNQFIIWSYLDKIWHRSRWRVREFFPEIVLTIKWLNEIKKIVLCNFEVFEKFSRWVFCSNFKVFSHELTKNKRYSTMFFNIIKKVLAVVFIICFINYRTIITIWAIISRPIFIVLALINYICFLNPVL
jgi:hypothetical protein